MKKNPPKFDKEKCKKCKYRGYFSNTTNGVRNMYCTYHKCDQGTYLKRQKDGTIVDIRGKGPNCKLYSEGPAIVLTRRSTSSIITKSERDEFSDYTNSKNMY